MALRSIRPSGRSDAPDYLSSRFKASSAARRIMF
jgi:hypothetical protein